MLAMPMNSATVTTTDLRRDFRSVLDRIIRGEHVAVSNYSKTCVVVVDPTWYQAAATLMAQEAERAA